MIRPYRRGARSRVAGSVDGHWSRPGNGNHRICGRRLRMKCGDGQTCQNQFAPRYDRLRRQCLAGAKAHFNRRIVGKCATLQTRKQKMPLLTETSDKLARISRRSVAAGIKPVSTYCPSEAVIHSTTVYSDTNARPTRSSESTSLELTNFGISGNVNVNAFLEVLS